MVHKQEGEKAGRKADLPRREAGVRRGVEAVVPSGFPPRREAAPSHPVCFAEAAPSLRRVLLASANLHPHSRPHCHSFARSSGFSGVVAFAEWPSLPPSLKSLERMSE